MQPVIRAGERLIVEESTAVVDARLEAVALGPAAIGSPLNVKLAIGGKVVRAVALAPGRAAFQAETEVSP
jgi:flagella basal body P-ring formation protein FlgA